MFPVLGYVFLVITLSEEEKQHIVKGWVECFENFVWNVIRTRGLSPG